MIAENKKKIEITLDQISDEYVNDILEYLNALQYKQDLAGRDKSSYFLSERSLAKEWLLKEEEDAWRHL